MIDRGAIAESDLHAYVDSELDAEGRAEVERWLGERPEEAARVEAWQRQKRELHARFDPVLAEPLPPALRAALEARAPRFGAGWMRLAAAVALLAVGAASGWLARGVQPAPDPARQFVQQAVGAHVVYVSEVRHPVEVRADEEAHLVTWLSNRLGQPIKAPKLQAVGFQLVGGRLLPDAGAPAAQFMYEDASGRRVMLYMRAGDLGAETAFRFAAERDVSAFYWIEGAFGYALTGKMPRDDLLELSRVVYEQLEKPAR